ncbi:MAG: YkgJ family cysteine cluster protein [Planctomycetes bacterium]|nr:YkgJ family cysteine cluster protein [Planctomycetota bacterium]
MDVLPILPPTSCDGCGICCLGIGSPLVLYASRPHYSDPHPFRPDNLPQELIDEINFHFSGLLRGQEPQEKCLWFDATTRLCKHHEFRPQVCRDYEIGGRECLRERREAMEAGEHYPLRIRATTTERLSESDQ